MGLHEILSPVACTLKVLDLTIPLSRNSTPRTLADLWGELEAMAGHNMLEALSFFFDLRAADDAECFIDSIIQEVEKVVKSGWSALRKVSFKFSIMWKWRDSRESIAKLPEVLQFLPDKYLSISILEFDAIYPLFYVVKCELNF